jgi:hypothetical protein
MRGVHFWRHLSSDKPSKATTRGVTCIQRHHVTACNLPLSKQVIHAQVPMDQYIQRTVSHAITPIGGYVQGERHLLVNHIFNNPFELYPSPYVLIAFYPRIKVMNPNSSSSKFNQHSPTGSSDFTDKASQTRRKNAEAQRLYRERKKAHEADLAAKSRFLLCVL